MQRFRPAYYETFVCMADRCPRTCCQEWKIYVDEKTESTGVPPNIYAFHRYTRNSAYLSGTQDGQFPMQSRG